MIAVHWTDTHIEIENPGSVEVLFEVTDGAIKAETMVVEAGKTRRRKIVYPEARFVEAIVNDEQLRFLPDGEVVSPEPEEPAVEAAPSAIVSRVVRIGRGGKVVL